MYFLLCERNIYFVAYINDMVNFTTSGLNGEKTGADLLNGINADAAAATSTFRSFNLTRNDRVLTG